MPRPSSALLALAVCLSSHFARGEQSLPVTLEWTAPPECPTGADVERELARITRVRPGRTLPALAARGVIVREGDGYRLSLELEQAGQIRQKQFDSANCAPLRKAASLVLVLALGEGNEQPPAPPSPATPDPAPPTPTRDAGPVESAATSTKTAKRAKLSFTPWAGAVASSGFVKSGAVGADLGFAVGGRFLAGFVRANLIPPVESAQQNGVTAELSATVGGVGGCGRAGWPSVRFDACLGFDAGLVRAHSYGAEHDGFVKRPWYALSTSLAAWLPLVRPFALRAEVAALLPFEAARYDVEPYGTLYAAAKLIPRASLGVAVEL